MIRTISIMLVAVVLLMVLAYISPKERYINCGLSEISPDFTPQMKEMCRQIRATKL
jgi:hypothetical protein